MKEAAKAARKQRDIEILTQMQNVGLSPDLIEKILKGGT
jgi:hypothetical protein